MTDNSPLNLVGVQKMTTTSAIELLRAVIRSPECEKMNRSTVKGYLGELLVKQRLEQEGIKVEHLGNQTGIDLRCTINNRVVSIDVKMSLPKDEFKWGFECWGWALLHENKKKPVSASHFICVGCSLSLEVESLFVVPVSKLDAFPRGIRQFSKVVHSLVLPRPRLPRSIKPPENDLYRISQKLLADGTVVPVGANNLLSIACS